MQEKLFLGAYDWSVLIKNSLLYEFLIGTLHGSGTERHHEVRFLFL